MHSSTQHFILLLSFGDLMIDDFTIQLHARLLVLEHDYQELRTRFELLINYIEEMKQQDKES